MTLSQRVESEPLVPKDKAPQRLAYYHELSPWQQDNHYIKSGYIKETRSYRKCAESLLYLHNETVNVYSHLIPGTLVLTAVSLYLHYASEYKDHAFWETCNFYLFGIAATTCLLLSLTFHCIKCHSKEVDKFGNQCDYFGIVVMITCLLILIINFAFYDVRGARDFFITIFVILGSICGVLTLHPKFRSNVYRPLRASMFITFGLSGVLPVLFSMYKFGFEKTSERCSFHWLLLEGIFYITGAVLYAVRIPERFGEVSEVYNRFDIFGASHQIFHFFVVIAAYCHWKALVGSYIYLHEVILR